MGILRKLEDLNILLRGWCSRSFVRDVPVHPKQKLANFSALKTPSSWQHSVCLSPPPDPQRTNQD